MTSPVDATAQYCLRLPGPSFIPMLAAVTTGGFFVLGTFHLWTASLACLLLALGVLVYWLWTGTAVIPEKEAKNIGLGLSLPLYVSGQTSVSWWAMFITMLADQTAFVSLLFGYFFFWTRHSDFPPGPDAGPGLQWPLLGAALVLIAWLLTIVARHGNQRDAGFRVHVTLTAAMIVALGGIAALLAGPALTALDPASDVYGATVWVLVAWAAVHVAVGIVMQAYCMARRWAGRMTARHDIDISNVTLYWHFCALTVALTVAVIAGFPLAVRG